MHSENSFLMIDTSFDFYSDTPPGKDPDAHSPRLRRYHQILWSKELPNGEYFSLSAPERGYLQWNDLHLASDAITNSYLAHRRLAPLIAEVRGEAEELFKRGSTIGAYTMFPGKQIGGKITINAARGMNSLIADRFDLTLEAIRRHYAGEPSPLYDVLQRYKGFFDLFIDFRGYVDFFLLNDLVTNDYSIRFFLPFDGYERKGAPADVSEYRALKNATVGFISGRAKRMESSVEAGNHS